MKHSHQVGLVGIAATLLLGTAAVPAAAVASVIDVGSTISRNGYIKGSGSYTNGGAYTKVCIGIQKRTFPSNWPSGFVSDACRTTPNPSSAEFSAPDVWYDPMSEGCRQFRTVVRAYNGGALKDSKASNTYTPPGCPG